MIVIHDQTVEGGLDGCGLFDGSANVGCIDVTVTTDSMTTELTVVLTDIHVGSCSQTIAK